MGQSEKMGQSENYPWFQGLLDSEGSLMAAVELPGGGKEIEAPHGHDLSHVA